jgi:deoxyxylulose-5-phosphate synthase
MKTPMQQIKNQLENANWDSPVVYERLVNWIDDNMTELLLTEKEIIEDAFFEGGLTNEPYEPMTGGYYYRINFEE